MAADEMAEAANRPVGARLHDPLSQGPESGAGKDVHRQDPAEEAAVIRRHGMMQLTPGAETPSGQRGTVQEVGAASGSYYDDCCVCGERFEVGDPVAVSRRGHAVHLSRCTFVLPHCEGGRHHHPEMR